MSSATEKIKILLIVPIHSSSNRKKKTFIQMHFCQSLIVGDEQSLAESGIGGKYLMCEKHALLARRDFFVRLCEADFATGHLAHLKIFFSKNKNKETRR